MKFWLPDPSDTLTIIGAAGLFVGLLVEDPNLYATHLLMLVVGLGARAFQEAGRSLWPEVLAPPLWWVMWMFIWLSYGAYLWNHL